MADIGPSHCMETEQDGSWILQETVQDREPKGLIWSKRFIETAF